MIKNIIFDIGNVILNFTENKEDQDFILNKGDLHE